MPQAEQSRSAVFERKPVDLKEWETTLTVILLLLICLITLTKCVSWNEPCNTNTQGRRGKAPLRKTRIKEERWHSKQSQGSGSQDGNGSLLIGLSHIAPPFIEWQSLQDQNTDLFKEKNFMVFRTEGRPIHPFAMCGPTSFLQRHVLVLEKITMCSKTQQVQLWSHCDPTERFSP